MGTRFEVRNPSMNRAPGRGVTCGARWMENLPHNWKWTWLNFSLSSPRECHKYASCVMSFEGAEDLASCRWFLEVKTRNEGHGLTNWAMPSDPIMEKWKWIIFRCPDGFHGDGETSCLPGDPEPSQVCLPCLYFLHFSSSRREGIQKEVEILHKILKQTV